MHCSNVKNLYSFSVNYPEVVILFQKNRLAALNIGKLHKFWHRNCDFAKLESKG